MFKYQSQADHFKRRMAMHPDWITKIVKRENRFHRAFFGKEFDLSGFIEILCMYGAERVWYWKSINLEPHFLPPIAICVDEHFPGLKIKPEKWYYEQLALGRIFRKTKGEFARIDEPFLGGIAVLVDTRLKPTYSCGIQKYSCDNFLGPIIGRLRKKAEIPAHSHGLHCSRFEISADDWENSIKTAVAKKLEFPQDSLRFETVLERVVISQMYTYMPRFRDNVTDTSVLNEEYYIDSSNRLFGGRCDVSGLGGVRFVGSNGRLSKRSIRPIIEL